MADTRPHHLGANLLRPHRPPTTWGRCPDAGLRAEAPGRPQPQGVQKSNLVHEASLVATRNAALWLTRAALPLVTWPWKQLQRNVCGVAGG